SKAMSSGSTSSGSPENELKPISAPDPSSSSVSTSNDMAGGSLSGLESICSGVSVSGPASSSGGAAGGSDLGIAVAAGTGRGAVKAEFDADGGVGRAGAAAASSSAMICRIDRKSVV